MDLVAHLLKSARSGQSVQMMSDGSGHRWVVVGGRFFKRRTAEFDLTREQYEVLRYALKRRRAFTPGPRYRVWRLS